MAAGGFKEFVAGEVLDEDDINDFLMQGVLVFAGTAARGSAITAPVEGQFSFLKDTDSVEFYDGTDWSELSTTPGSVVATGGNSTAVGTALGVAYQYHVFTSSGNFVVSAGGDVEVLMVAGGGAGGFDNSQGCGGGGAGGLINQIVATTPQTYSIVIGDGGSGTSGSTGSSGNNTTGFALTADGGGGGGNGSTAGAAGGSGGGAGGFPTTGSAAGGTATQSPGFGNDGGASNGTSTDNADGGGGAGAGSDGYRNIPVTNNAGDGGFGLPFVEFATATSTGDSGFYAGGGGGGDRGTGLAGSGGIGGGGDGGVFGVSEPTNGTDGTGGGGGGGRRTGTAPGDGGSGIVIVRYAL